MISCDTLANSITATAASPFQLHPAPDWFRYAKIIWIKISHHGLRNVSHLFGEKN
jgi:hypothetical protein